MMSENKNRGHEAEKVRSPSPTPEDEEFELTAEMMIHEFDDEATLNEDEEETDTNEEELADLAKEGDMPLEELLALYYGPGAAVNEVVGGTEEDTKKGETTRRALRSTLVISNPDTSDSDTDENERKPALADEERKVPRIGEEYQVAEIPIAKPDKLEKYNYSDLLVWTPCQLPEESVVSYLKEVAIAGCPNITMEDTDTATFVQDNEDALFFLAQCGNNSKEALGLYKTRPSPLNNEVPTWSEEECQHFEDGLAIYGKDFYMIHSNRVQTRSVREIIRFYYMWKKSERCDQFIVRTRLGKKKEFLSANVTDYMKKLLDETEKTCTASIMNHSSGTYLKYSAHSVALTEHLKRQEEHNISQEDVLENVSLNAGGNHINQANTDVQGTDADVSSFIFRKEMIVNSSNMQATFKK